MPHANSPWYVCNVGWASSLCRMWRAGWISTFQLHTSPWSICITVVGNGCSVVVLSQVALTSILCTPVPVLSITPVTDGSGFCLLRAVVITRVSCNGSCT